MSKNFAIQFNGVRTAVVQQTSLHDLINTGYAGPAGLVVEHNGTIIPSERWRSVFVGEGDSVELLTFVGGG